MPTRAQKRCGLGGIIYLFLPIDMLDHFLADHDIERLLGPVPAEDVGRNKLAMRIALLRNAHVGKIDAQGRSEHAEDARQPPRPAAKVANRRRLLQRKRVDRRENRGRPAELNQISVREGLPA